MARRPPAGGSTPRVLANSGEHLPHQRQPQQERFEPPGNVIIPNPWTGDRNDTFFIYRLAPYLRRLVVHPGSILDFVRSNPITNAAFNPRDNVYKSIVRLTKFNNLI